MTGQALTKSVTGDWIPVTPAVQIASGLVGQVVMDVNGTLTPADFELGNLNRKANGYMVGGDNTASVVIATSEKYDSITDSWASIASLPVAKTGSNDAFLPGFSLNGYGYVAGGMSATVLLATSTRYNSVLDSWVSVADMPIAKYGSATFSLNGFGYLAGGHDTAIIATSVKYDSVLDTWSSVASLPVAKFGSSAFSFNGYGYAIGGDIASGPIVTGVKYDSILDTWASIADMLAASYCSGAFSLNGYGYVVGGVSTAVLATSVRYDSVLNSWVSVADMPTVRQPSSAFSLNGYGYANSGYTTADTATCVKYDSVLNSWISVGNVLVTTYGSAGFSLGNLLRDYTESTEDMWSNYQLILRNINTPKDMFVKAPVPTPGVSSVYGTAVVEAAIVNKGILPKDIEFVVGGTVGTAETVIIQITASYGTAASVSVTHSFTAVGNYWLTINEIVSLMVDGDYITQLAVESQSSLTATTATTTANIYGIST